MNGSEVVNVSDWEFSFGGSDPKLAGTGLFRTPTIMRLATPLELLLHLAEDGMNDSAFQNQIQQRLKADPVATAWHKQRGKIGSMLHFSQYRKDGKYDEYHAAAVAVAAGTASGEQLELVLGLDQEIAASEVIIPDGQVLFHGRGDRGLHASASYASFISTSLDPIVCVLHANKRQLQKGPQAKAVIYLLTTRGPLHAIWGNGGGLNEWELLLPSRLTCKQISAHECRRFDVVNASIGQPGCPKVEPTGQSA